MKKELYLIIAVVLSAFVLTIAVLAWVASMGDALYRSAMAPSLRCYDYLVYEDGRVLYRPIGGAEEDDSYGQTLVDGPAVASAGSGDVVAGSWAAGQTGGDWSGTAPVLSEDRGGDDAGEYAEGGDWYEEE